MSETYSSEGPQCPHCGRQFTADEPIYYDEMQYTRDTCDECEKPFAVRVLTSVAWMCEPIDPPEDDAETDASESAGSSPRAVFSDPLSATRKDAQR